MSNATNGTLSFLPILLILKRHLTASTGSYVTTASLLKIIDVIKMLYSDFLAKVICGNNLKDSFEVKTGVEQGYVLSPFLFVISDSLD